MCDVKFDLVILDVFIPVGQGAEDTLGSRAKMYEGEYQHLGGLELIDFFNKMESKPKVLMHTACFDYNIISMFSEIVDDRIPKPASVDVFIKEILGALNL
jgi:response regulator of citrate/malate metabolism